jgi:hypothetical protein
MYFINERLLILTKANAIPKEKIGIPSETFKNTGASFQTNPVR